MDRVQEVEVDRDDRGDRAASRCSGEASRAADDRERPLVDQDTGDACPRDRVEDGRVRPLVVVQVQRVAVRRRERSHSVHEE